MWWRKEFCPDVREIGCVGYALEGKFVASWFFMYVFEVESPFYDKGCKAYYVVV